MSNEKQIWEQPGYDFDPPYPASTPVITNYDRLISKTPEELAQAIEEFSYKVVTCPKDKCHLEPISLYDSLNRNECRKCWLSWLKTPAEDVPHEE